MQDPALPLADGFAPADRQQWLALVAKTLQGAGAESLTQRTADSLEIQPLYRAGESPPLRFRAGPRPTGRAWEVRAAIAQPDPAKANEQILEALNGGAASVLVSLDPGGVAGVAIAGAEGLAAVLEGVLIDLAPVALDAGYLGPAAADWLGAAAKASPAAPLALHLDPLSALARAGVSPGPIESHIFAAANTAVRLGAVYPRASLVLASGRVVHEAGGSEALELAVMASAAVIYAKALTRAGLSAADAFERIVLGLTVDASPFLSIAKLRAARIMFGRIAAACGAQETTAVIEAASSRRMLTTADPWTNLVRLTAAGFAAATGGADAIVLGGFTDSVGLPAESARRLSRNTQLILMEEAHLGEVADPLAGSGAIETLTGDLARAGWTLFQEIEAGGGLVEALRSGLVADRVNRSREGLAAAMREGALRIVGVTDFVDSAPTPAPVDPQPDPAAALEPPDPRLPGPDSRSPPLTPVRLETFAL